MSRLFLNIVNMSISASWLVLAVLVLRLILKRAPKWVNVLLWSMVALRLVFPFSIESALSLIPSAETIPANIEMAPIPAIDSGIGAINSVVNPIIADRFTPNPVVSANPLQIWIGVLSLIWVVGVAALLIYTAVSYWRLRRMVSEATLLRENLFQCEGVGSPFVLGIIKPRIYLPYHMEEQDLSHVVAHEQAHIRRRDHWWKPLGFLLLTVHWFNPLMWLAYVLLCRDIELACDEKVIKELGSEQRADYTQALLTCSVNRRMIAACPLAFGEVGVKERVKSVMHYRKPAFWVIVVSVIACVVVAVCFLTDPSPSSHLQAIDHGDHLEVSCQLEKPIRSFAIYEDIYKDGELIYSKPRLMDNFVEEGGTTPRSFSAALSAAPMKNMNGGFDGALACRWARREGFAGEWILALPDDHYTNYAATLADGTYDMFMELDVEDDDDILLYSVLLAADPAGAITGIAPQNGDIKTNAVVVQYRLVTSAGPLTEFQDETETAALSQSVQWTYSPMMSATWHGFFCFDFEGAMYHTRIEASCDNGTLHNLSAEGQPYGKKLTFEAGEPVCWSPDMDHAVADAQVSFTLYRDDEALCSGTFDIVCTGTENGQSFHEARLRGTDLLTLQQGPNSAAVVRSDTASILVYSDLNHNGVQDNVIVSKLEEELYELRVEERGQVLWSTQASPSHAGWRSVMLYSEGGKDYLVEYLPTMYQGIATYVCTVFSLENGQKNMKKEWTVDFALPTEETPEMERFAREVGLLLRNCYVLLSTQDGIVVDQYTNAADLPQIYPVYFDPWETQEIRAGIADWQVISDNAAEFPNEPLEFLFASGAGGWGTVLNLNPDGSFTGSYQDSDMGSGFEEYPNGVCRVSEFEGIFTEIQQITDYAWSMKLDTLTTRWEPEETWVEDGTKYIAAEPHGVAGGEEFILYAPGTPGDLLTGGCRDWWPDAFLWRTGEHEELEGWCLCNANTGHGFFTGA